METADQNMDQDLELALSSACLNRKIEGFDSLLGRIENKILQQKVLREAMSYFWYSGIEAILAKHPDAVTEYVKTKVAVTKGLQLLLAMLTQPPSLEKVSTMLCKDIAQHKRRKSGGEQAAEEYCNYLSSLHSRLNLKMDDDQSISYVLYSIKILDKAPSCFSLRNKEDSEILFAALKELQGAERQALLASWKFINQIDRVSCVKCLCMNPSLLPELNGKFWEEPDKEGNTLLHLIALYGIGEQQVDLIKALLELQVDLACIIAPNANNHAKQTPLWCAAKSGNLIALKHLYQMKEDSEVTATEGESSSPINLIGIAAIHDKLGIIHYLFSENIPNFLEKVGEDSVANQTYAELLWLAIKHDRPAVFEFLLDQHPYLLKELFPNPDDGVTPVSIFEYAMLHNVEARMMQPFAHYGLYINFKTYLREPYADYSHWLQSTARDFLNWEQTPHVRQLKNALESFIGIQIPVNESKKIVNALLMWTKKKSDVPLPIEFFQGSLKLGIQLLNQEGKIDLTHKKIKDYIIDDLQHNLNQRAVGVVHRSPIGLPMQRQEPEREQKAAEQPAVAPSPLTAVQLKIQNFVDKVTREFDDTFCFFRSLSQEKVNRRVTEIEQAVSAGQGAALVIGVAAVREGNLYGVLGGAAAFATCAAVKYYCNYQHVKKMTNFLSFLGTMTPLQRTTLIDLCSQAIAERYEPQIKCLAVGSEGVERFAQSVAIRVIGYITDAQENAQEPLGVINALRNLITRSANYLNQEAAPLRTAIRKKPIQIFLDGVILWKPENVPLIEEQLQMERPFVFERWTSQGILEHSGIRVGDVYYANAACLLKQYGYSYGEEEQARKRRLSIHKNGSQELWQASDGLDPDVALGLRP